MLFTVSEIPQCRKLDPKNSSPTIIFTRAPRSHVPSHPVFEVFNFGVVSTAQTFHVLDPLNPFKEINLEERNVEDEWLTLL